MKTSVSSRHSTRASTHLVVITTLIVVGTMLAAYLKLVRKTTITLPLDDN